MRTPSASKPDAHENSDMTLEKQTLKFSKMKN